MKILLTKTLGGYFLNANFIDYQYDAGVAQITLNRPDKLNSFNRAMALELQEALAKASKDDDVRAVLLTGAGRGFCAGQDLEEVVPQEGQPAPILGDTVAFSYNPIIRALRNLEKPVICAVNGVAAGAGANIAVACDLVIASEKASFVQSFCNLGLVPDSGGTFFLPRLVGMAQANRLAMLGEKIRAEEAVTIGLIYKCLPVDSFLEEAKALAAKMAKQPTRGFGLTKRAFNQSWTYNLDTQLDLERDLQTEAGNTYDYNEGVAAFLEKRPPKYRGN